MAKDANTTESEASKNASRSKLRKRTPSKWQERLLPTMNGLLIGLTIFFFLTTFGQMAYLHWSILQVPEIKINQTTATSLITSTDAFADRLAAQEMETRSRMEAYIVTQRYHQASVLLMSGLWLRYLGFITGMILALVGASFVLGKLREPTQTIKGGFSTIDLSLRTTSPGIVLAILGVILMFATIQDRDTYNISDANTYLYPPRAAESIENPALPTLISPEEIFGSPVATPQSNISLP